MGKAEMKETAEQLQKRRKELESQLAELNSQIRAITDAEYEAKASRVRACVKECRKAGLHKCFTAKVVKVKINAGTVSVELDRRYEEPRFQSPTRVHPQIYHEVDCRHIEKRARAIADVEESRMEKDFEKIRAIIEKHGLIDETEVFEMLMPRR